MTHRPRCRSQRTWEERAQFVFTALTTRVPKEGTTPDDNMGFLQLALRRPRRNTQPCSVSPPAAGQGRVWKVCTAQNPARAGRKVLLKARCPANKVGRLSEKSWLPPSRLAGSAPQSGGPPATGKGAGEVSKGKPDQAQLARGASTGLQGWRQPRLMFCEAGTPFGAEARPEQGARLRRSPGTAGRG